MQITLLITCYYNTNAQAKIDTLKASQYFKKANILVADKKTDSATTFYIKALILYQKTEVWEKIASCYNKIALNYKILEKADSLYFFTNEAYQICRSKLPKNHMQEIKAIENFGYYYFEKAEYNEAKNYFMSALEKTLKKPDKNYPYLSNLYNNLGITHSKLGKFKLSLNFYKKALEHSKKSNKKDNPEVANYYNNIGLIHFRLANYDIALDNLFKARDIQTNSLGEKNIQNVRSYLNIGNILASKGYLKKALGNYIKALEIQLRLPLKQKKLTASIYNNIGIIYKQLLQYDKALMYNNKALKLRLSLYGNKHLSVARSYNNIANIYYEKNELTKALKYYNMSINLLIEIFDDKHFKVGRSYYNIGSTLLKKKKIDEAFVNLNKSLTILEDSYGVNHPKIAGIYSAIALCYKEKKNWLAALEYSLKALDIFQNTYKGISHPDIGKLYNDIAMIYKEQNRLNKAIVFCKKALHHNSIASGKNNTPRYIINDVALSTFKINAEILRKKYLKEKNIKNLNSCLVIYLKADSLLNLINQNNYYINDKLTFSENTNKIYTKATEVAYELYKSKKNIKPFQRAFYFSEKSKANILQGLLQENNAKNFTELPQETLTLEKELKTDFAFYTSQIIKERTKIKIDSNRLAIFENKIFDIRRKQDSLTKILETNYPKYYQLKHHVKQLSPEDIQKRLPENTTFLEFFTTDSAVYAFSISKNNIDITKLETSKLEESIANFRETITSKDIRNYKHIARQLYNTLLKPITNTLIGNELIIIPDGPLWHLNFDLLLTQNEISNDPKEFPYLLKKYAITYANSANLLFSSYKNRKDQKKLQECLAFSFLDNVKISELNSISLNRLRNSTKDLPGTREEIRAISEIVDGQYYYGTQAIEVNFKKNAPKYNILHLALHGEVDHEQPEHSKLYFTKTKDTLEDNLLYSHELFALDIPAELTVLSACNTGTGKIAKGEGIMSLGNAFQYAGTKSLLLSRWEVSDKTTPELMKYFYTNLKEGMNKAKALQQAKLTYLKTSKITRSHPFFWGSFYLLGNSDPIDFNTPKTFWIYGILTILILLSIGIILYRRKKG